MQQKSRRLAIIGIIIFILFGIIMVVTHRPSTTTQRQTHPNNISVSQFISQLAPQAQREQKRYHIPASVIIAQAGTESNWGRNKLAVKYNNLFGVKASKASHESRWSPLNTSMARKSTSSSTSAFTIAGTSRFASIPC